MTRNSQELPPLTLDNSFAALPDAFYTRLTPAGLTDPRLFAANSRAAALIGLDAQALASPQFPRVFAGNAPLPGGDPLAAVYSGHQFGVWAGQLGDGRAHLLGEVRGPAGNWEIQLKGAGPTPYSRRADGRAVLRSSVREYLASEAMYGLGIPTTQALALVVSDDPVWRETVETAAVVARMAPSFVRFGSFEHWSANRDAERLRILADYVIDRFYPECRRTAPGTPNNNDALVDFLGQVVAKTAELIAGWQSVGFCHGVMNTDNMSILGLTLDYGPFGFMDGFNMAHICNHTDTEGRYAWNRQASVGLWNLYRLASSLSLIVDDHQALRDALDRYEGLFAAAFYRRMGNKLGLGTWLGKQDEALLETLLQLMHAQNADFTLTFRALADAVRGDDWPFLDSFADRAAAIDFLAVLRARHAHEADPQTARIAQAMDAVNPLYVLRNHLAENAIRAARTGDSSELDRLMVVLRDPFRIHPGAQALSALPPDWARTLEVSCSS